MSYAEKIEALVAERDALRNDAERYRWLRTHRVHQFSTWRKDTDGVGATGPFYVEHLDAAIDAAMAEAPAVGCGLTFELTGPLRQAGIWARLL